MAEPQATQTIVPGESTSAARLQSATDALPGVAARLARKYAHEPATRWQGKYWVTEIKRLIDEALRDAEHAEGAAIGYPPASSGGPARADGRSEGTRLHAVLEAVDPAASDPEQILATARRLAAAGRLPAEWVSAESLAPICDFFQSSLGREMGAASGLEREVSFSLRLSPERLARIWPAVAELGADEWILVQGQIDALWSRADGTVVVLDFKSDLVTSTAEINARAERYRPQMMLYREAVEALWQPERLECWLHFLRPARAIKMGNR